MTTLSTFCKLSDPEQIHLRAGIWPLAEHERSILEMRLGIYCLPHTQSECAAKLGCEVSLVQELESRAVWYLLSRPELRDIGYRLFPNAVAPDIR
jgi:DNA-directed RNA polymerase specialized sigma subunit